MSSSTLNRKELKRPDAFLVKTGSLFQFLSDNIRLVILLGVVAVVVATGATLVSNHLEKKNDEASGALYLAKKQLAAALEKAPKDGPLRAAELNAPVEALTKVAARYPKTAAAFGAFLAIGDAYFEHGQADASIEYYKKAIDAAPSPAYRGIAQSDLAFAYENTKNHAAAVETLQKLVASPSEKPFRGDVFMALGRNYEAMGDKASARNQYDQILKDFPNTPNAKAAQSRKDAL